MELTAPYMHDGKFATLDEVIAHYNHGVQRTPTLDPNLAKHPSDGLRLTREDQNALVAFLKMLTDVVGTRSTASHFIYFGPGNGKLFRDAVECVLTRCVAAGLLVEWAGTQSR